MDNELRNPNGRCLTRSFSANALDSSTPGASNTGREGGSVDGVRLTGRKRLRPENTEAKIEKVLRDSPSRNNKVKSRDVSNRTHTHSPLRRSKRERRLIYANLTPGEIDKTIMRKHTIKILETSEDEELEPYEKLLSPVAKKSKKFMRQDSTHNYMTRSSLHSNLSEVWKRADEKDRAQSEGESLNNGTEDDEKGEEEEEEDEEDEEDEEGDNEEEEEEPSYYNLRKRQPVVYQYQPVIQVVDKEPRKKTEPRHRSFSYRSAAYHSRKQRHLKNNFRQKAHQDSTTSSSEDSDEERFKRRKSRSMKRARLECLPMNFAPDDIATAGTLRDRTRIGTSLADISPMNIDRSITFESVGGLREHITALKEMVVFPLLYPEVFDKFKISPPRGVLFHGPPGCGKTLVARALANECSKDDKKIAFFMRKGADCLSKWVGESERQLRLLFDQAYQMRPSILFFDEIDGLAPVRSTRQDQIHSSIVSTLLALMDGLDSRGEIVVIGATNRIDSIDPALRRPGRFDREFAFPLPTRQDRHTILKIHTKPWNPPLREEFLDELSELTVGYCGADLRALCTEAAMYSLRRHYPQIYHSSDKLLIDVSKLNVAGEDFYLAYKNIVPTAQRSNASVSKPLSDTLFPLLGEQFEAILKQLIFVFPESWKCVCKALGVLNKRFEAEMCKKQEMKDTIAKLQSGWSNGVLSGSASVQRRSQTISGCSSVANPFPLFSRQIEGVYFDLKDTIGVLKGSPCLEQQDSLTSVRISTHPHILPCVHRPRLLLTGKAGMGHTDHLTPALLHACEDIPVKLLDLAVLLGSISQSPEEACIQVFREARRVLPCIVYVPRVGAVWEVMSPSFQAMFKAMVNSLPHDQSILLLATADCEPDELPLSLKDIFPTTADSCFIATLSTTEERKSFFYDVLLKKPFLKPPCEPTCLSETVHEPLPLAPPPPPRELSEIETNKMKKQREAVLRELRVFLRETTNRLLAERKYKEFTKPVNQEEVPDYYEIITQPMDLSTIMKKIDEHQYCTPKQWIKDINLITANALEYNPEHDSDSRLLRHRALALQDQANSIYDHELNEEFEKQCEEIEEAFRRREFDHTSSSSPLKKTSSAAEAAISTSVSSLYMTPKGSISCLPQGRTGGSESASHEVRRSLRRLGVKPDSHGIPYYPPPKPRTPKKEQKDKQDNEEQEMINEQDLEGEEPCTVFSDNESLVLEDESTDPPNPVSTSKSSLRLPLRRLNFDEISTETSRVSSGAAFSPNGSENEVIVDQGRLLKLFSRVVSLTEGCSVELCLKLHATLSQLVFRHRMTRDKMELIEELELAVEMVCKQRTN